MKFIEFTAVIKRHKLLVVDGLLVALLLAVFTAYKLDGTRLVSRTDPVYESTAVVALKPGAELLAPTPATTVAPPPAGTPGQIDPAAAPTTTAVPTPTVAPTTTVADPATRLDDVIDSRGLYYAALSIRTVVVSPGFSEAVKAKVPSEDASITAVVALDTNTISLIASGSSPTAAGATMAGALAELKTVVASYSQSPASRFALDAVIVSAPSGPTAVSSIKAPLTFVLVFSVAVVAVWVLVRTVDTMQLERRARRPWPAPERDAGPLPVLLTGNGDHKDEVTVTRR